jgi:hypothetical protein
MSGICLPPQLTERFKQALVSGKINPEKLAGMTSEKRHQLFSELVGEHNAKFVNSQFEAKTLLKNQQQGYITWAKKLTGVTPEVRRDLMSRIQKMDRVLNPEEEKQFLRDLAETKLGFGVTSKEAEHLANMSNKLQELAGKMRSDKTFPTEADRMAYGRAKVTMGSYVADLKNKAGKQSLFQQAKHPVQVTSKVAGLAKSLKASLDNSAIFRQGWKTLWTNPRIWQKNARKSFVDIAKQLGGKDTLKEVQADIVSRPNFRQYEKMKLAIGNVEEEFPSTLPEKIPGLGRVYKASEGAYTGFLYRQRADVADKLLQIAEKSGVDTNDKTQLEAMGKLINSLTGRGNLGRFEGTAASTLNNVFFSVRFLKSNIDTLTAHQLQKNVTPFVRKQAALNLVKVISGTAAILTIANALKPGSVDWDPRSSNFGKIKVGSTKFDVTGGMGSIAVLAAQLAKNQTKSATTGVLNDMGTGLGQQNRFDVTVDFFANKASPAAAVVRDLMKGQDFNGNKPTVASSAKNLLVPLPVSLAVDNRNDPQKANQLLISLVDGLGVATSGKTPERNVSQNLSASMQGFKDKVGATTFKQANDRYNSQYNQWLADHQRELKQLSNDDQKATITNAKEKIQKTIYKQYGYKPSKAAPDKQLKATKKHLLESIR